ncbi:transcriptional regulator, AraC family protein [Pseudooceanicola batsensis HTCC2597]|uniref:Transcriptional regulator, AraC family protein n=1 Tax=Pseudooceanicola batsensis (strain ATCC BAA-863 / DSM 15984 / KCTC 12145 / HTCC2597) TaxID=252305 RepID=A3TXD2_PSEBH|nr:helix-turn-helix domain-containing protein [Pseudooceanicola batsensis]EAQ03492.1 transcriptional regulator, AraC family protein [Pseudooceanicola batsensis HTCC2597]
MLNYHSKLWDERARGRADFQSLLFSAPDHFNMSKGPDRRLRVASADFPGIGTSLLSVTSSGHEIDLADDKFLTVMMPTRGRTLVRMDRQQQVIREDDSLALGPSERWTRVERGAHQDFRANLAKISLDAAPVRHVLPVATDNPVVPTSPAALAGFKALIRYMFSDLASAAPTLIHRPASDLFAALVIEHIRLIFLTAPDAGPRERPQHALVRRAEDFMLANLSEPLTVPTIAEAIGVSVRQLQDAFRQSSGQTPWDRLTAHRLHKARQRLLAGCGDSVTTIAFDCGFSHLGRFAQTYRVTFGEAPSTTLRRARGSASAIRTGTAQNG